MIKKETYQVATQILENQIYYCSFKEWLTKISFGSEANGLQIAQIIVGKNETSSVRKILLKDKAEVNFQKQSTCGKSVKKSAESVAVSLELWNCIRYQVNVSPELTEHVNKLFNSWAALRFALGLCC